eukprot:9504068-Pyramimonas_sp.AAC.2
MLARALAPWSPAWLSPRSTTASPGNCRTRLSAPRSEGVSAWRGNQSNERKEDIPGGGTNQLRGKSNIPGGGTNQVRGKSIYLGERTRADGSDARAVEVDDLQGVVHPPAGIHLREDIK